MLSMKIYLFLFLCLNLLFKVKTEFEINHQYVKIKDSNNIFIKSVTIHKSEQCYVYINNNQTKNIQLQEYTVYVFYTTVSCKFADWAINTIYDFIKISPLLYRYKFENYHHTYQKVFHPLFEQSMNIFIKTLKEYIDRLINILNNFLDLYSHSSYYNDTTILKELISLKIKIDFLSIKKNQSYFQLNKSDSFVIRIVLEEMNALQRFLSMNCLDIRPNQKNSTFYGYWITVDDVLTDVSTINNFLYNMRYITLELGQHKCSITQIFLENIVTITSNDPISHDIANTKIKITGTENISIKNILEQIKVTYDIDLIFWYQDSILTSIIKLIYTKVIKIIKGNQLSQEITSNILEIDSKISENKTKLPVNFVNGFTFLAKVIKTNKELIKQLEDYEKSLSSIEFEEQKLTSKNTDTIILGKSQHDANVFKTQLKSCILVKVKSDRNWDDFKYLNILMMKILSNFDDFKCFHNYFKFLRNEQEKYFIPFIRNKKLLLLDKENSYDFDRTCTFILNVYSLCHRGIMFVNGSIDNNSYILNETYFKRTWRIINDIKDYFLRIIKSSTKKLDFLKMAFNIAIILINLQNPSEYHNKKYHLERIFHVIMSEINYYGIKHCTSSKFNYLLFTDINFVHFSKSEKINNFMNSFFEKIITKNIEIDDLNFESKIKIKNYEYLSVQYLYDTFIKNSTVCKLYGNYINVYWKGKKQTVKNIYENSTFSTLNSLDLYALYDIYFKFYIAVLYYEMKEVLKKNKIKNIKNGFSQILKYVTNFQIKYFPQELKYFILDIIDLLNTSKDIKSNEHLLMEKILEHKKKIDVQFEKFNFVFEKSTGYQKIKNVFDNFIIHLFTDKALKKINIELSSNVLSIKNYFSKLKHQRIIDPINT